MPYKEQPFRHIAGPKRYPEPDWDAIATVATVWVPENGNPVTVGYLVRQDPDALAWLSHWGPDDYAYELRKLVEGIVRAGAASGTPPAEVWADVMARTMHKTPKDLYLPAFLADVRSEWS